MAASWAATAQPRQQVIERLRAARVVPVVRTSTARHAATAVGWLRDAGLRIPGDISIVGFGNILTAEFYRVPLTTVSQPKYRLGAAAMDSMLQLLRRERPESKRIRAEIILRQSTAAPRTAG